MSYETSPQGESSAALQCVDDVEETSWRRHREVEGELGGHVGAPTQFVRYGAGWGAFGDPLDKSNRIVVADINVVLFYGQSLSVGAKGLPPISISQPYNNLTWDVGPKASKIGGLVGRNPGMLAFKPLVEDNLAADGGTNRGETPCSGCANEASLRLQVDAGIDPADHVILVSTAGHGGYSITQLEKGAAWFSLVQDHIIQAKSVSDGLSKTSAMHALCWLQGEQDAYNGTMSRETYKSKLTSLRNDVEKEAVAAFWQTHPVHLLTYQLSYKAAEYPEMALAQLELCKEDELCHLVTPTYHLPHDVDGTHLTNLGYLWIGKYYGRAYAQIVQGMAPIWIEPVSAKAEGNIIEVECNTAYPLVVDRANLAPTQDDGFKVLDAMGAKAITDISIRDERFICIVLDSPLVGEGVVRYALDYMAPNLSILGGASGNIRDTAPGSFGHDGKEYPLFNVLPHFELAININTQEPPIDESVFSGGKMTTVSGEWAKLSFVQLLAGQDTSITVEEVSATSEAGGAITMEEGSLVYRSAAHFTGEDSFSVVLSDGQQGVIAVTVKTADWLGGGGVLGFGESGLQLQFNYMTGRTAQIERSADLREWVPLTSAVADELGRVHITDPAPLPGSAYYRLHPAEP